MSTLGDILYRAVDGSFAIDADQRIIYWDAGCEDLLGYSSHWALGRPCCSVLQACNPSTGQPLCKNDCPIADLAKGGSGQKSFFWEVKARDGESIFLSVSIILVPSACKHNWHVMHLLHRAAHADVLTAFENTGYDSVSGTANRNSEVVAKKNNSRLTPRELQVLGYLAEGISSNIIAKRLSISHTTVRNHIQHIQTKLGVHSQTEAVVYAYRHQYV